MKHASRPSLLDYIDCTVAFVGGAIAVGYAVAKTPMAFWLPAWLMMLTASVCSVARKGSSHWPSTILGVIEVCYIAGLVALLAKSRVSFDLLSWMFFGLLFIHGLIYVIAAKAFWIHRGYLKPRNA